MAAGVQVTVKLQLAPAPRLDPQLLPPMAKPDGTLSATLVAAVLPLLVSVTALEP